jgi:hypothetical protein
MTEILVKTRGVSEICWAPDPWIQRGGGLAQGDFWRAISKSSNATIDASLTASCNCSEDWKPARVQLRTIAVERQPSKQAHRKSNSFCQECEVSFHWQSQQLPEMPEWSKRHLPLQVQPHMRNFMCRIHRWAPGQEAPASLFPAISAVHVHNHPGHSRGNPHMARML